MMLWPAPEYIDSVEARVIRGEIPIERLNDAVQRIWELKWKCGLFNKNYKTFSAPIADSKAATEKVVAEIAESSVTLVRDLDLKLPISVETSK
jgi:beta-N-acetylhexosaminidase